MNMMFRALDIDEAYTAGWRTAQPVPLARGIMLKIAGRIDRTIQNG